MLPNNPIITLVYVMELNIMAKMSKMLLKMETSSLVRLPERHKGLY